MYPGCFNFIPVNTSLMIGYINSRNDIFTCYIFRIMYVCRRSTVILRPACRHVAAASCQLTGRRTVSRFIGCPQVFLFLLLSICPSVQRILRIPVRWIRCCRYIQHFGLIGSRICGLINRCLHCSVSFCCISCHTAHGSHHGCNQTHCRKSFHLKPHLSFLCFGQIKKSAPFCSITFIIAAFHRQNKTNFIIPTCFLILFLIIYRPSVL